MSSVVAILIYGSYGIQSSVLLKLKAGELCKIGVIMVSYQWCVV